MTIAVQTLRTSLPASQSLSWLLTAAFFFTTGSAKAASKAEPEFPNSSLTLVWHDGSRILHDTHELVAREVKRIFGDVDIEIHWEKHDGREISKRQFSAPHRTHVYLMPSLASSWGLESRAMGVTTYRNGRKGSIYIFYPEIERTLNTDTDLGTTRGPRVRALIARAVGRVVVHEVVHVLASGQPHDSDGLMKASLTRRFLLGASSRAHLDSRFLQAFRADLSAQRMAAHQK